MNNTNKEPVAVEEQKIAARYAEQDPELFVKMALMMDAGIQIGMARAQAEKEA